MLGYDGVEFNWRAVEDSGYPAASLYWFANWRSACVLANLERRPVVYGIGGMPWAPWIFRLNDSVLLEILKSKCSTITLRELRRDWISQPGISFLVRTFRSAFFNRAECYQEMGGFYSWCQPSERRWKKSGL